jgi:hypothetical protein
MMALDASFDVGAITLAGWTAIVVFRNRRRTRELRSAASPYYALTIRTLLFVMMITVAFITNITIVLTSFANHVAWVVIAFVTVPIMFVFGSDPTLMRILGCQRDVDAAPVVSEHSISISLPQALGERVRASGIQNTHELPSIRRAPGLNSESEWKTVVLDGLAFKSIERLEDLPDDREAKYTV